MAIGEITKLARYSTRLVGLAGLNGASYLTYQPPGGVVRAASDKLAEVVSVKDKGAQGTGFFDDTDAFLAAGAGAYVPPGEYLVDISRLDISRYWGRGRIHTYGGQTITLTEDVDSMEYRQRSVMVPNFGFNGTEIYPTAINAPQGLALDRDPLTGEKFFYISQPTRTPTWGAQEYIRITKWRFREDGGVEDVAVISPEIRSSHAHLSTLREDGKLYMYQSYQAPLDSIGLPGELTTETGKGWSKLEWKDAATSEADLVNYQVWGRPGSGHRYEHMGKGCVQVSQCGKYMILIGINYTGTAGGRTLFVYDRKQVESAANPLECEPVFAPKALLALPSDSGIAYQGETCDGKYIYILWGHAGLYARRGISIYNLQGEKIRDINVDGPAMLYNNKQLREGHPDLGMCMAMEPEGITLEGDTIYITWTDYWRKDCPIVTYDGLNYVNIAGGNQGNTPNVSFGHWRVTTAPANDGAYDPNKTYERGLTTVRRKVITATEPRDDRDLRQKPCITSYQYADSVAVFASSASELIDFSVPLGKVWRMSVHDVNKDSYRVGFQYGFGYTLDVRDSRDGSDNNVRGFLRTSSAVGEGHVSQVGSGDGTAAGGAIISMYSMTSSVNPGALRLNSAGSDLRLMHQGATKMTVSDTEIVDYQTRRFIDDGVQHLGTVTRRAAQIHCNQYNIGVSTCTITSGTTSPEGVVTAALGSIYINRATGKWWRKNSGTGNTGWLEVA